MFKLHSNLKYYSYFLIFWFVLGCNSIASSQDVSNFKYIYLNKKDTSHYLANKNEVNNAICDSVVDLLNDKYINKGYLSFSVDSIRQNTDTCEFYIFKGVKYKLTSTLVLPKELFGNYKRYITKPTLTPEVIKKIDFRVLKEVRNNGFPYATLNKEFFFDKNRVFIQYNVNSGEKVFFDSIKTSPYNVISYSYLSNRTGIKVGGSFNASALENINKRINQDRLFKLDSVYFNIVDNRAKVTLKIKKINQNSFSGLVGVQTNKDKKTEITGNASMVLVNAFKKGERIVFDWQKPGKESQQLEASFKMPYFFGLPIGVSFRGYFDKQDTLFTNTNLKVGLLVPTHDYGELSINGKWLNSSVSNTESLLFSSTKGVLYGLGYSYSNIDNPVLVRKGVLLSSEVYLGSNSLLNSGGKNSKTTLFEWLFNSEVVFPLPIGGISIKNEWAVILNDSLRLNNLYRVGGVKSIRGFNERSIYARAHTFVNSEYHLYINSLSYFYLLYDIGLFNEPKEYEYDNFLRQAIGAGISVYTQAGRLTISYALGKVGAEPFFSNKGQVHIGYINLF